MLARNLSLRSKRYWWTHVIDLVDILEGPVNYKPGNSGVHLGERIYMSIT